MARHCDIVLVAPNWLGDAVMSLPLVGFLSAASGLTVRVVAPPYTSRVFAGMDGVTDLTVLSRTGRLRGIGVRSAAIRRFGVDGGLVLPPSFSSALTLFLGRVPHRVGFTDDGRRFLLNVALSGRGLRNEHLSENFLRLGRAMVARLDLETPESVKTPRIQVFDQDRERLVATLRTKHAPTSGYAVVLPGAMYGSTKHWPHDKYRALIAQLSQEVSVVLAGGPAERGLCETISDGQEGVVNMAGETSLGELFALLEGARVVVANDSGAPHAAASMDVPVVVIFGSTSPVWTKPLGPNVRIIQEPVRCSPCFLKKCPTQLECYEGIDPDRVFAEACDAMTKTSDEAVGSVSSGG